MVLNDNEDSMCPICCDDVYRVNYTLPCGHKFHKHCIKQWTRTHNTCPICRAIMVGQYICYNKKCKFIYRACMMKLTDNQFYIKEFGSKIYQYPINHISNVKLKGKMVEFMFKVGKKHHKYNLLIESKYLASYFYNALKCCKMNNQYHNLQTQMMHLNNSLVNY